MKKKITLLALFALTLSFANACTFQSAPASPPAEPTRTITGPMITEEAPAAPTSATLQPAEASTLPSVTESVIQPEETTVEAETSPDVEDPFAAVDPQGQRVFLWYFLPAQSPADQAFNQVVDLFNSDNPEGIFIDAYNQSTAAGVLTRTLPVLNTTDVPGLIMTNPDLVAELDQGLQDLTPLMRSPRWGLAPDMMENFSNPMIYQGQFATYQEKVLSFPLHRQAQVLFGNIEWITELGIVRMPGSPAEIQSTACQARDRGMRRTSNIQQTGIHFAPGLATLSALIRSFGGDISDAEADSYIVNSPEAVEALQFVQILAFEGCASLSEDPEDTYAAFDQGQTALLFSNSAGFSNIESLVDMNLDFAWDATGFPRSDETEILAIPPGLNFSIPRSTSEQMVAAWSFVKFFHSPAAQAVWIPPTGNIPLASFLVQEAEMPIQYQSLVQQSQSMDFIPAVPKVTEIDLLVSQAMQDIIAGTDVTLRLNQLQAAVDELVAAFYTQP